MEFPTQSVQSLAAVPLPLATDFPAGQFAHEVEPLLVFLAYFEGVA